MMKESDAHTSENYEVKEITGLFNNEKKVTDFHIMMDSYCQFHPSTRGVPQPLQNSTDNLSVKMRKGASPGVAPPFSSWITDLAKTKFTYKKAKSS